MGSDRTEVAPSQKSPEHLAPKSNIRRNRCRTKQIQRSIVFYKNASETRHLCTLFFGRARTVEMPTLKGRISENLNRRLKSQVSTFNGRRGIRSLLNGLISIFRSDLELFRRA